MPYSLRAYPQNFLINIFADSLKSAFITKSHWTTKNNPVPYERYRQTAYYLKRKGYIKFSSSASGQKFLELTHKGQLGTLLAKSDLARSGTWDGKWRLVIFDIPEDAHSKRDQLRRLLKQKGFYQLQASVYVSPYALNREAISYLKITGLIKFIRFGRLEELDDDADLKKYFKLK